MKKITNKIDFFVDLFQSDKELKTIQEIEKLQKIFEDASFHHNKTNLISFIENLQKISNSYQNLLNIMNKTYKEKYQLLQSNFEVILKLKEIDSLPLLEFEEISKEDIVGLLNHLSIEIEYNGELNMKEFISKLKKIPTSFYELTTNLKALNSPILFNIHQLSMKLGNESKKLTKFFIRS